MPIKPCLESIPEHILSKDKREAFIAKVDDYVKNGMSEKEAGMAVVKEMHKDLHNRLNDLKKFVDPTGEKLKQVKYNPTTNTKETKIIKEKYNQLIENKKQELSKQGGQNASTQSSEPPKQPPLTDSKGDENLTGITHAQMDETAREFGLEEYETKPETKAQWDAEADSRIQSDTKTIPNLIKKLEKGFEPDHIEQRIMIKYISSLKAKMRLNPSVELLAEYKKASDLSNIIGGRAVAKSLVARQASVPVEDNLPAFVLEKQEAGTHALSEAEIKEQAAKFEEIQKAKEEYKAALDKAIEENAKLMAQAEINKNKPNANKVKGEKKTHEDYVKERQDIVKKMREDLLKAAKGAGGLQSSIPGAAQLKAIAPHILRLVESVGNEFGGKLEEIVSKVYEEVKDIVSKKDIYDIIAGVHTDKKEKPTRNQLAEDLRNAKKEAALLVQLQKERLGETKAKSPAKKGEKKARIQELENKIKEVRKLRKEKELEDEGVQEMAVENNSERLAKKQKTLLAQIDKIQKDLKSGNFLKDAPKEKLLILDKKTQLLQDRYADLQRKRHLEIEKDRYNKMSKTRKVWDRVWQILGLRRVIQTAIDFSIPFRQNITTTINPFKYIPTVQEGKLKMGVAARQFKNMFHYTFSPKAFKRMMFTLKESGLYHRMVEDGITLSEPDELKLDKREEEFRVSIMTQIRNNEKLGYARYLAEPFTTSERAAAAALNTVRIERYMHMAEVLKKQGITRQNDPEIYKAAAKFIMNMTGRGNMLQMIEDSHSGRVLANNTFYGARLMASRFNLLNPVYYVKMPKELAVDVFKDMAGFTSGLILTGLALKAAGGSISLDPDDSDFLQVRFGDTRYDISGGMVSYVKTFLRLAKLAYLRTTPNETKAETSADNKYGGFVGKTGISFFTNKFAPNTAYAYHFLTNVGGDYQPFEPTEVLNAAPMYMDDVKAGVERSGASSFATIGIPSLFGVGAQTYSNKVGELTSEDLKSNVWKVLNEKGIYNPVIRSVFENNNKEYTLTDEQKDEYATLIKDNVKKVVSNVMDSQTYKNAPSEDVKKVILKTAYREGRSNARGAFLIKHTEFQK